MSDTPTPPQPSETPRYTKGESKDLHTILLQMIAEEHGKPLPPPSPSSGQAGKPAPDLYDRIAERMCISRQEVKLRINRAAYSNPPMTIAEATKLNDNVVPPPEVLEILDLKNPIPPTVTGRIESGHPPLDQIPKNRPLTGRVRSSEPLMQNLSSLDLEKRNLFARLREAARKAFGL